MGKLQDLALGSAPQFKCLIPSKGIMAKMRAFLVREQKLLLMAKETGDDQLKAVTDAVNQLLQNCMIDDIDVDSLPSFDVEYMFVQLFMHSTASKTTVAHYQCKAQKKDEAGELVFDSESEPVLCNEVNKIKIDLSTAKVSTSEIKSGIIEVGTSTIEKVILKYPTFDQLSKHDSAVADSKMDEAFRIYGECLRTIYKTDGTMLNHGEDFDTEDAIEFMEYLSGNIFEKIADFFNDTPSITADVHFKCKSCDNERTLKLRGLEDFF